MGLSGAFTALVRRTICAAALIALSAGWAAAAPALVVANTNMRQGPGTGFGVIATVPGGSTVQVGGCRTGVWCSVYWGGLHGYMIARNLDFGGPVVRPAPVYVPPPVVVAPYPYYWGPRYYYGPRVYYGPRRYYRRSWRR